MELKLINMELNGIRIDKMESDPMSALASVL